MADGPADGAAARRGARRGARRVPPLPLDARRSAAAARAARRGGRRLSRGAGARGERGGAAIHFAPLGGGGGGVAGLAAAPDGGASAGFDGGGAVSCGISSSSMRRLSARSPAARVILRVARRRQLRRIDADRVGQKVHHVDRARRRQLPVRRKARRVNRRIVGVPTDEDLLVGRAASRHRRRAPAPPCRAWTAPPRPRRTAPRSRGARSRCRRPTRRRRLWRRASCAGRPSASADRGRRRPFCDTCVASCCSVAACAARSLSTSPSSACVLKKAPRNSAASSRALRQVVGVTTSLVARCARGGSHT